MLLRFAAVALCAVICLPTPVGADPGVPVFHDRVVKRDRAGDVQGDRTTPVDIRKVQYDHYRTGRNERLVITVRFDDRLRKGTELNWGTSTGASGYSIEFRATVGGGVRLERDGDVVRRPHVRRVVEGRGVEITIPWRKLGSPDKLVGPRFWAVSWPPHGSGIDKAFKDRAVLE